MSVASKFPTDTTDDKLALASIGQGDTVVTPLQNALVAAAVANGGQGHAADAGGSRAFLRPVCYFADQAAGDEPRVQFGHRQQAHADDGGGGHQGEPESGHRRRAGGCETGTAQIGDGNTSIDGWVVGFAPADDPKIAVAVVVHNVDLYGSFAAGPIMKAMMQEALAE